MATREENLKKINEELEKLSDEELENVAGGTIGELEDLTKAMMEPFGGFLKGISVATAHIPVANRILADKIEDVLENQMGIKTDISLGVGGTGICSKNNTYQDIETGKYLTHQEVLDRIARAPKHL